MTETSVPETNASPRGRGPRDGFWRRPVFWLMLAGFAAAALLGALLAAWVYIQGLDVSRMDQPLPAPTLILDRYGNPASQLSASKTNPVPLAKMPKNLVNAVIAVEDKRFYQDSGLDVRSIARALADDLRHGGYDQGASTITQQLARNLFLTQDKTIGRKLKEAAYAIKLDETYSKNDILETYLNSIYLGEGSWGVEEAAKTYFGKDVWNLNLPEAAMIAALPKAPSHYSPFADKSLALERRNLVLSLMRQQGKITEQQDQDAVAAPLGTIQAGSNPDDLAGRYPGYVNTVIEEAVRQDGFTEEQLLTGGLRIQTELDPKVQQAVDDVYKDDKLFPKSKPDQLIQSGAVVIDQKSGGIRAVAAGRGDSVFLGFNHATQLRRQPGSSFKPIAVYGPALEQGDTPDTMLYDGPLNIGGYQPQDWDHQTRGEVTMEQAIVHSWNIPAVWTLNQLGIDSGLNFAAKLGIKLPKADRKLGIALGGLSEGVSPLQMAQAFSAFANQGKLTPAHAIDKITTADGHVLYDARVQSAQVMTPQTAYWMTAMLQDAVQNGTGQAAAMDRPAAGKSGTTQLPDLPEFKGAGSRSAKDAWFAGYTPELTAAIWVGYDHTDGGHYLTTGSEVPAALFREIMTRALAGVPVEPFPPPPGLLSPNPAPVQKPPKGRGKHGGQRVPWPGQPPQFGQPRPPAAPHPGPGRGHGRGRHG